MLHTVPCKRGSVVACPAPAGRTLETAPSAHCPQNSTEWMDSRRSLSTNHQRSIHYLSTYAFPLQRNHQQRKPTRPPTTTMTATEIPAMAPVESPLLLAPEDTQEAPLLSRLKPLLHSPHTSSITQLLQSPTEHSTHPLPSLLGFLPLSQAVHTAEVIPGASSCVGAVHWEQPSTPTYALALS
eukprot:XP_001707822.1 Hypothetical protein GL50803_18354 [Giardia lamblia ATCC 50803]